MPARIVLGRFGTRRHISCVATLAVGGAVLLSACKPSDVLSVSPPAGVTVASAYNSQSGAEQLFSHGKGRTFAGIARGFSGLIQWAGLLGDEFDLVAFYYFSTDANIEARRTTGGGGYGEAGDATLQTLLVARVTLLQALPLLKQYEPAGGRSKIGEAYALVAYTELLAAENYCAGLPLGQLVVGQGVQYGTPLTRDSLLGVALADFDSAAANASGSDTIQYLAAIGQARTMLNLGQFAAAGAAVSAVPTSFVYNTDLHPGGYSVGGLNLYDEESAYIDCGLVNVADRKGVNGLNYLSARDPRLVVDSTVTETCDGELSISGGDSVFYFPTKFGYVSEFVPMASGVEARLIEAEAALNNSDVPTWTADLNDLRADSADTRVAGLSPLTADSTTAAGIDEQVDVMFRERAFWLYGEGYRVGDMRRLVRQYGRDQNTVFSIGPYPQAHNTALPTPLPNYGTDVSFTLPTGAGGLADPNPNYRGCLTPTSTA